MTTLSIAGATGSIGRQSLEVVENDPDFEIVGLSAFDSVEGLVDLTKKYNPQFVVLGTEVAAKDFRDRCADVDVLIGDEGLIALAESADVVMNAVIGFAGLRLTLAALNAGKRVALANKESMVAGGGLVKVALQTKGAELVPVDSEHSAIHQCLGTAEHIVSELVLTSTGGPFRSMSSTQLQTVAKDEALAHPRWNMGPKITIDSSTLMNKGLEIIEAHELFGIDYDRIRVVVHPEAVVHSAVTFSDGSTIAQMSQPDMRLPISYALNYPGRSSHAWGALDWASLGTLTFEEPDRSVFPALDLAESAGRGGGAAPIALNAANEVAVEAFLADEIGWTDIVPAVAACVDKVGSEAIIGFDDVVAADGEARQLTLHEMKKRAK